jgi:hypothetical protein
MKTLLLLSGLLAASFAATAQSKKQDITKSFAYHFRVLDSLAALSPSARIENVYSSIRFMEKHTGIEALADGNYVGKFDCYKTDLQAWHWWYQKKHRR